VIEWNCVSFDMANPLYREYHKELVKDHVRRFGIDGSRIDCAMGGLTNWNPYGNNRPSNSNLKGGVEMSGAIRQAFVETGKTPIVTPENFNPVPMYYKYTDIFYDMPLYRALCELDDSHLTPEAFAYELTRWLNAEMLTTPKGYSKMRFLGNHDTVSWVFQKARAPKIYGEAKAKALWALISFIDGMPMLYQGDEDPKICRGDGPELREFFRELFNARKTYLGNSYDMEYEFTGTPVMAFTRRNSDLTRKILVNFSEEKVEYVISEKIKNVLHGNCSIAGEKVCLQGFGYVILDIE
jgi:glycosidase